MDSRESQNVGYYKRSGDELETVESSRTCSIPKTFFCSSQSAGSHAFKAFSVMCSDRALKTQSAVGIAPTASHTASFKTEQFLLIFPIRRGKSRNQCAGSPPAH